MNTNEFIEGLKKLILPLDVYEKAKVSKSHFNYLEKMSNIAKRKLSGDNETDPVIQLVTNYHVEDLEIGMIAFGAAVRKTPGYTYFGKFEIDDLVINNLSGEIQILQEGTDHKLWICAVNSGTFLAALLHIGAFFEKRVVDESVFWDEELNLTVAKETAAIAGGDVYFNFYRTMLGI